MAWIPSIPKTGSRERGVSSSAAAASAPAFGASLGTPTVAATPQTTTVAMTTNVSVPAGARSVVFVSWYNAAITATLAGGGLTWSKIAQVDGTADTSRHFAVFVPTAAGPTTGTTLTATFSGNAFGRAIFGAYFTSAGTVGVNSTAKSSTAVGGSMAWDTGSALTTVANSVLVGGVWLDGGFGTSAPAANTTEALDFTDSLGENYALGYRVVSATGTYSIGGTFTYSDAGGGTEENLAAMVTLSL